MLAEDGAPLPPIVWTAVFKVLNAIGTRAAMCCIKSFCNSCATSARYHDLKLEGCALGCHGGHDDLAHYILCARLWTVMDVAAGVHVDDEPDTALQRHLLDDPSMDRTRRSVVAYSVYHALRNGHLDAVQRAWNANSYERVLGLAQSLADAFAITLPRRQETQIVLP